MQSEVAGRAKAKAEAWMMGRPKGQLCACPLSRPTQLAHGRCFINVR